jgi:hypothetical protein
MSRKTMTALVLLLSFLTALNVIGLILNFSQPSGAAIAGMSYQDLMRDQDFTRAVQSVAQDCKVNIDLAKLVCTPAPGVVSVNDDPKPTA